MNRMSVAAPPSTAQAKKKERRINNLLRPQAKEGSGCLIVTFTPQGKFIFNKDTEVRDRQ